jgi:hypothetical protein
LADAIAKAEPLLVYVKIPGHIEPFERGQRFEDPIQEALERGQIGEITGGGSQLSPPDEMGRRHIEFCGIDVDLYKVPEGLALLKSELRRLNAPRGTVLSYRFEGRRHEEAVYEA